MDNLLDVQGLEKEYPGFCLHDVSFSLPEGYIMGFIGPNGAGKTTTIKLILNMIERGKGTVRILGLDNIEEEETVKEQIGAVFDTCYFPSKWDCDDVERAMSLFYKRWDREKFFGHLRKFGIDRAKKVGELSRGMQMKLMLSCAFSHEARLLILDEPTSGLDPVSRDELLDILAGYIEDGERSVLFSTHITSDLERAADYITYIKDGAIFYTGAKDEIEDMYRKVKGGPEELTAALERKLLGLRRYSSGFEALIRTQDLRNYGLLTEPANIDDIIVFTSREDESDE